MATHRSPWRVPDTVRTVAATLGTILLGFVPFALLPLVVAAGARELNLAVIAAFAVPATLALVAGALLRLVPTAGRMRAREAVLVVVVGWATYSVLGALPLWCLLQPFSFLDAVFESTSGLTTTGITLLTGLDTMSKTVLWWRSELQFIGGLGILTFFLAVTFRSGEAPFHLFTAESHKISSPRLTPSVSRSLKFLLGIYVGLVALFTLLYAAEGMTAFDAVTHAMTSISTGGFSTHDASLAHFQQQGYPHFRLIEWTAIAAMLAGGINFFVHFRVLQGEFGALWDSSEIRTFWGMLVGVTGLIFLGLALAGSGSTDATLASINEESVRTVSFQAASLITSTGYGTMNLTSPFFPLVAQPLFLVLMLIGGSVGSTTGGLKLLRVVILYHSLKREIQRLYSPRRAVRPLIIDGQRVPPDEVARVTGLFFGWLLYVGVAGVVTMLLTSYDLLGSFSGALSMVSNMGPTYMPAGAAPGLPGTVKVVYIVGMLAGRLEILPVLLFFTPRAWK